MDWLLDKMKIRKSLTKIALGTLDLIGVSCNKIDNSEYHFNGKINDEKVYFYERGSESANYLKVIRKNGTKVNYRDYHGNDLKLEKVIIKKDGKNTTYSKNHPFGKKILEEAQKQFDAYLDTIHAINYQEALDDISK